MDNVQRESYGGLGGIGGTGASGIKLQRSFKATYHTWEYEDCSHEFHCSGAGSGRKYENYQEIINDDPCPDQNTNNNGNNGKPGTNWIPPSEMITHY